MRQENRKGLESRIITDSKIRWVREKTDPELDSNGTISGGFCVTHDITGGKRTEKSLHQSEKHVRSSPDTISSERETKNLDFADIIDVQVVQSLMEDFYKLTPITMALVDLKGNILVRIGWQDICTKFHRVNSETCKHCVESDTKLSAGVVPGEFKLYRCRNNMWDIATPIMVGGNHVGNIFSGQFFFEDEPLDYEFFRSQAKRYCFDEELYMAALEKVPRLRKETVGASMSFLTKLAHIISQLSYSNIKLSQSLAEHDSLVSALRESDERFRSVLENSLDSAYRVDLQKNRFDYISPVIEQITGFSTKEIGATSANDLLDRIHPDDRPLVVSGIARSLDDGFGAHEYRFKCKDGKYRWLADHFSIIKDKNGMIRFRAGIAREITERKQAEKILAFERSQLLSIFDGMDDSVYVTDPYTYEVLYANKAVKEKFGGELVGGICYREFQRRDSPCDFCTNPIILKERDKPYHWEYYNPTVDRHFMIMDRILKWPDGRDVRFEIAKDITERKKAEEDLRKAYGSLEKLVKDRTAQLEKTCYSLKESEEGLSEAQKIAHIGNWEWYLASDETYWSEETYRIFGRDPGKAAPSYSEYLSYIHPDDRDNYCNSIKKHVPGKPFSIDYRIVLVNGEERTVHMKSEFVMDDKNIPVKVKGTVQDITERKKSEEKIQLLANIVKSSNDAIGTISLDDIITSCNEEVEHVYGYSAEEVIGKHTSILAPPHLHDETKQLSELIKQGKKIHHYETLRLRKDGKIIHVSITLSPVFDSYGNLTAVSFISRDITKRKEAEEALTNIETARKKEIHHRIKNNLQVISSLLDLQAEKFNNREYIKDSEVLEAFRESQDRVISMALIHEELYKDGGFDTLNFSSYIEKLAENLFRTYRLGNDDLSLNMDLEENIFFDMDIAVPLGIIVNELVSNSLKHAFPTKEGKIRIHLCRQEKNNKTQESLFILTVSDNGKGIPQNIELENTESLGLKLVNILVDQLDGNLDLKREHGTKFRISFKVVERP